MALKTLTFRTPEEKVLALDSVAALQQRDRTFIINEAVDQYLSLYEHHCALIDEGLRAADAGDVLPQTEVVKMAASWSRKPRRA